MNIARQHPRGKSLQLKGISQITKYGRDHIGTQMKNSKLTDIQRTV